MIWNASGEMEKHLKASRSCNCARAVNQSSKSNPLKKIQAPSSFHSLFVRERETAGSLFGVLHTECV